MQPLLLYTPPHSGTHYVRLFLELHTKILGPWVVCKQKQADGRTFGASVRDFFEGRITATQLDEIASTIEIEKGHAVYSERWFGQNLGLNHLPKRDPIYRLIHAHSYPRFQDDDESATCFGAVEQPIKSIVTLRDPMLSILTCLIRYEGPWKPVQAASTIPRAYMSAMTLGGHVVPVGTHGALQAMIGSMDVLRLELEPEQVKYLKRAPAVNATTSGDLPMARAIAMSAPEWVFEARKAYSEGEIHTGIKQWVPKLRGAGIQHWLIESGFEWLPWYE